MSALPRGWSDFAIDDIADSIQYGHTASAIDNSSGPRFLRITDIQDGRVDWNAVPSCDIDPAETPRFSLQPGDLVFARTGATTGKSFLIRDCPSAVYASYLIRLRMRTGIDPAYVAYYFQSLSYWRQIEAGKRGIGQPNVNATILGRITMPVAPISEQHRIVAKIEELFSDLDAGVAALKRVKANLKRYRASVLKAAVEGRLTEEWRKKHPATEPAAKLLERILAERRAKWEQDQLRKFKEAGKTLPKGWKEKYQTPGAARDHSKASLPLTWCWAQTDQLGWIQLGRQRSPKNRSKDHATKYIRAANITESGLDLSDLMDMEFQPHELETYRMKAGDVVLSEASGSPEQVGKPAIWKDDIPDCCFQNTVIRLRPCGVRSDFLLCAFKHFYVNKMFAKIAGGVGINHLSAAKFARIAVPLPPLAEQAEIVAEVDRRLSVSDAAERQVEHALQRAARLRQAILKRAFEGKLVPQDSDDPSAGVLLGRVKPDDEGHAQTAKSDHLSVTRNNGARPPKPAVSDFSRMRAPRSRPQRGRFSV